MFGGGWDIDDGFVQRLIVIVFIIIIIIFAVVIIAATAAAACKHRGATASHRAIPGAQTE